MKTSIANILEFRQALNNLLEQKLPLRDLRSSAGEGGQGTSGPYTKQANEARLGDREKHGDEIIEGDKPIGQYQIKLRT